MTDKFTDFLKYLQKFYPDLISVVKGRLLKIFATLGAVVALIPVLEGTFLKKYIENSRYWDSIGLTKKEFAIISFLTLLLYLLDRFLTRICNAKPEEDINSPDAVRFKYDQTTRSGAKIGRLIIWVVLLPIILLTSIRFTRNNDYCDSQSGKMAIKICQFSDSYEKGGDEDEISIYIHNSVNHDINNDTVEVSEVFNQVKDGGSQDTISKNYLSCFIKGIFVYGYRSPGQSTFFCNIFLKNMKNVYNKVEFKKGITIVLDDPKLISFKEVYKAQYISHIILGLYRYYNKEYRKAIEEFSSLTTIDSLPKQIKGYGNLYIGYSKLLLKDTSGYSNIRIAEKIDEDNVYAKKINEQEKAYNSFQKGVSKEDSLLAINRNKIVRLAGWPSAVVAIDKMNIFYVGAKNEVSILVNGVAPDRIKVRLDSGVVSGSNGRYNLTFRTPGVNTLRIMEKEDNGSLRELYEKLFRVKNIPSPKILFAGKSEGLINFSNAQKQNKLGLNTDVEDLPYDIKFRIKMFTLVIKSPRQDGIVLYSKMNGELTPEMKYALKNITHGTKLVFSGIVVSKDASKIEMDVDPEALEIN